MTTAEQYEQLTGGFRRGLRPAALVDAAAERFPGRLPSRADLEAERARLQKDKVGLEIEQGAYLSEVFADARCGLHLIEATSHPLPEALSARDGFARTGHADLGTVRVDRDGAVGHVTLQNHDFLNAEDEPTTRALEIAVDLVLLDDACDVGVLRGAPATKAKYAGRRVFGSGLNLTHLYHGRIPLVGFMIERELGLLTKIYRGHDVRDPEVSSREKPWIAAVETFAIGGACQLLLVMDRVIAERDSYFNLPARKEGIIPGAADLRLARFVGERMARQAIFFERVFHADSPEGRLLADDVVESAEVDAAVARAAAELLSAGRESLVANRRALRAAQEPLDLFRRWMSAFSREQALCFYSPALISNLERNWDARRRSL